MPISAWLFMPELIAQYTEEALRYPDYFAHALIAIKILGVVVLALPKASPELKKMALIVLLLTLILVLVRQIYLDKHLVSTISNFILIGIYVASYFQEKKNNDNQ